MPPVGLEPTISAGERPQTYSLDRAAERLQTYALDRAATGTGDFSLMLLYSLGGRQVFQFT